MASQIDPTLPVTGNPTTASVRSNFQIAHDEIGVLQGQTVGSPFLSLSGGRMTGQMYLFNDPTDAMMPATKGYVDAHSGSGGGGIPEAPSDTNYYGRHQGAWAAVLPLAGGTLTGPLIQAADPVALLGTATKQYVDNLAAQRVPDAPNDANTYGRHANAWAGVLPITGGQLTGATAFLGIGRAAPTPAPQYPLVLSSMATADEFDLNAYQSGAGTYSRIVAGTAVRIIRDGATGRLTVGVAASGAAGSAATFPNLTTFDYLGNISMNGAPAIPTDAVASWLSVNELTVLSHIAFNSYIASPANWKYLTNGWAGQLWFNVNDGSFNVNTTAASGSAGGALATMASWQFLPGGGFIANGGPMRAVGSMVATASAGNAYLGSWQTSGTTPSSVGIWNYNNVLYFGNADGNGVVLSSRGNIDASGNLAVNGNFQTSNTGIVSTGSVYASQGLFQIAPNYYMQRSPSDAAWRWCEGGTVNMTLSNGGNWSVTANASAANFIAVNGCWASNGTNFGIYPSGGVNVFQYSAQWYWGWNTTTGDMTYNTPSGGQINTRTNPDQLLWNNLGPVGGYGAYIVLSDDRAKRDVAPTPVGLPEVLQLEPIIFTRAPHEPRIAMPDGSSGRIIHAPEIGFSAQQVRRIIPEAVRAVGWTLPDGSGGFDTDEPSLAVTDIAILAAVVNAMKTLDARLRAGGL